MDDLKTSEAQRRASRTWEEKNPERTKYLAARRQARSFIRNYATEDDLVELEVLIKERRESKLGE